MINILEFIPPELRKQMQEALVGFLSEQAKKYVGDGLAEKISQLRSDGSFRREFNRGLESAIHRFSMEYLEQDEDLVAAIAQDHTLLVQPEVKQALMAMLKTPGAYLHDERALVTQAFNSVLPERINRERVNRAIQFLLQCLAEELWHLPVLQPVYSLQFQRISAEALHAQITLYQDHLHQLTDVNEGIRHALVELTAAIGQDRLATGASEPLPPAPRIKHNLPQLDDEQFIGRHDAFQQVLALLSPVSHHRVVGIDGPGGIGKSLLALKLATYYILASASLDPAERFEAIIWASLRSNVFLPGRIISQPVLTTPIESIFHSIIVTLEYTEGLHGTFEEQAEIVRHLLLQQRTLLIVDNFETIHDEQVLIFLMHIPLHTKVLLTSRHQIELSHSVRLKRMDFEEAISLIRNESKRRSIAFTENELLQITRKTQGLPLAIVLVTAQIAEGYGIDSVLSRLGRRTDEIARYCFENVLAHLRGDRRDQPTPAWKLLMALSLFPYGAGLLSISEIAELNFRDALISMKKLEKLSLINQDDTGQYWLIPLLWEYAQDELESSPEPVVARIRHNFARTYMKIKIHSAQSAQRQIHAVHLAIDLSDLKVWDTQIFDFLVANQEAIQRGVEVIRIFVLEKKLTFLHDDDTELNPEIIRIFTEQAKIGVKVYILWQEVIDEQHLLQPPDMIIFDTEEVHLHEGHGGWYIGATISKNREEIQHWEEQYAVWLSRSLSWSKLLF